MIILWMKDSRMPGYLFLLLDIMISDLSKIPMTQTSYTLSTTLLSFSLFRSSKAESKIKLNSESFLINWNSDTIAYTLSNQSIFKIYKYICIDF